MKIRHFKNLTVKLLLAQLLYLTYSCGEAVKPSDDPNNKIALEEIKKEPKIKEAIITDANVLYVTVEDDKTNRDGYAQYLCEILKEHKASSSWVKVVKANSINDENSDNVYGILLGESNCN
ncbi:hypothetical protein DR871_005145 [Flavobacterium petrolei]|jgi:hypothetical protein|uniref:Uncharacterized protein n=1 Tax=Flavobacterium petrolei TaxID=2259594 RepID=A0A482U448_9FLAO|nr:hypothetical protein [Flavobacterium petrolei]RYJ53440.1 hypothetical protein DR871_005145 [Flavobacterium petrolei]